MEEMLFYDRMQFAFTITFHYLFPQLTMGLSLIIVYFKWKYLKTKDEQYNHATHFWMKIFALNFAMGVVTGIPMEFQFGTNWAKFSELKFHRNSRYHTHCKIQRKNTHPKMSGVVVLFVICFEEFPLKVHNDERKPHSELRKKVMKCNREGKLHSIVKEHFFHIGYFNLAKSYKFTH